MVGWTPRKRWDGFDGIGHCITPRSIIHHLTHGYEEKNKAIGFDLRLISWRFLRFSQMSTGQNHAPATQIIGRLVDWIFIPSIWTQCIRGIQSITRLLNVYQYECAWENTRMNSDAYHWKGQWWSRTPNYQKAYPPNPRKVYATSQALFPADAHEFSQHRCR